MAKDKATNTTDQVAEALAAAAAVTNPVSAEMIAADRLKAEQAEADRVAAEQAEAERLKAEQAAQVESDAAGFLQNQLPDGGDVEVEPVPSYDGPTYVWPD